MPLYAQNIPAVLAVNRPVQLPCYDISNLTAESTATTSHAKDLAMAEEGHDGSDEVVTGKLFAKDLIRTPSPRKA